MTRRDRAQRGFYLAIILAIAGFAFATSAKAANPPLRCTALVTKVNELRTPDLRLMTALCQVAAERTARFAAAGRAWHNAGWAATRLQQLRPDLCIDNLGEAIGQTTFQSPYASAYAARFAWLWHESEHHWPMIASTRYTRAGGYMSRSSDGTMFSAFYVVDTTC